MSRLEHYAGRDEIIMRYSSHRTMQEERLRLSGDEFMERFSWHVVEKGFRMVRYYGFLSPSKREVFPTDDSVKKVVWLAIQAASQKWTMPLRDWRMAMSRFIIEFGDRLDGHF